MKRRKRVLVAYDGSNAADHSVLYLSQLTALRTEAVVLMHVFSPLPDYYFDMEGYSDPILYGQRLREAQHWDRQSKAAVQAKLNSAREVLIHAGFAPKAVEIRLIERQTGFARDIIQTAKEGFDFVFLGRKATSHLAPCALGSVTAKLLQKLDFVSLVLVGEAPDSKKALIALDGSACATRALNATGSLLLQSCFEVTLIHIIRGVGAEETLQAASHWGSEICAAGRNALSVHPINTKIVSGQVSRAEAIIENASQNSCGTIVMGRKGLSDVTIFCMGSVCHKVLHATPQLAVWVCV